MNRSFIHNDRRFVDFRQAPAHHPRRISGYGDPAGCAWRPSRHAVTCRYNAPDPDPPGRASPRRNPDPVLRHAHTGHPLGERAPQRGKPCPVPTAKGGERRRERASGDVWLEHDGQSISSPSVTCQPTIEFPSWRTPDVGFSAMPTRFRPKNGCCMGRVRFCGSSWQGALARWM